MAVRQYIGARYVPTFADPIEWNNTRTYEALTMVTYYNDTYISKKPVPTGTAITNTEYWVKISNFNQQVSDLTTEVSTLQEDVENININPFIPHLKNKKILICGASNDVNTAPSGREKTWARKLKELLNGIATVDIVAVGGAKLAGILDQAEANVANHDIIFIPAPGNDVTGDTEPGGTPRTAVSGTYAYQFDRLKTLISANTDKTFIVRGITPMSITRSFSGKYPIALYNNYCVIGSLWSGAIYVDGTSFYGNVNDEDIGQLTSDGVHFKAPATDRAVYNALCILSGFVNNNNTQYTEYVKDEVYNDVSYPRMSSLITLESNFSVSNWRVNRINYSRDFVEIIMRFGFSEAVEANSIIFTLDEDFCKMFNLVNKNNLGELSRIGSTNPGESYGCRFVGSERKLYNQNAISGSSGVLFLRIKFDTGLMFDYPYDYHE